MSTVKQLDNVREGYPELHDFDGSEYVKASDYDARLHASDVYFDSWKNTEAQFNQQKLELDAACGEIALLKEELQAMTTSRDYCNRVALHNKEAGDAIQQRLTVAEQRADALEDLLRGALRHVPHYGKSDWKGSLRHQINEALKPAAEREGS